MNGSDHDGPGGRAHAEYRALFDDAPDGVFVADGDLRILDVNARGCELVGRTRDQIVGQLAEAFLFEADLSVAPIKRHLLENGERVRTERRFRLPTGEPMVVEIHARKIASGKVVGFVRDVTDREEKDASLRQSQRSFRALIDAFPDGVVVHDMGVVVYANPSLERILGHPLGTMLGSNMLEAVHPDDRALIVQRMAQLDAPGKSVPFVEERLIHADGHTIVCEVAAVRVSFEGRDAVAAIIRDISERIRLQSELARADRMTTVGRLAAGVAHEIGNPLTFVLLNLEHQVRVLESHLEGGTSPSIETLRVLSQGARFAHEGTERVARIVKDLKNLSRREDEPVLLLDVNEPIEAAVTLAAHELDGRGRLELDLAPRATALGAEGRLCQVFVNLLVNAAHALDPAKASENVVAITTRVEADTVTISIRDTGSGISSADLERVFVPFFTTKPAGLGTGLGLPISRDIVEAFGGTLTLASVPGAGTTATIVLRRQAHAPSVRPSEGKTRRRLLVVDDDDAVLGSTAELLSTTYDVTTATSTRRAKELLEASTFDAVVCDVTMGGTSGPELAAWSKARGIDAPFVLMSGQGPASARDAKRVHAVFLEKPFLEGVLVDAVERALRAGKAETR